MASGASVAAKSHQVTTIVFIALLVFVQVPSVLVYTVTVPILAGISRDLAHGLEDQFFVKLISGILGPAMALGSLVGGWSASKIDRRWLVMALGTLYVVTGVAPALLSDLRWIVATRCATGLAAGALAATCYALVGDYLSGDARAKAIGMLSAVSMVASLISLPTSGFVGDYGWRTAFLLYSVASPVILLATWRAMPPVRATTSTATSSEKRRWYHILPLGIVALALAVGAILTLPAIYISFRLNMIGLGQTSTVGLLMMMNSAVACCTSIAFGKIWGRSPRLVFSLGFLIMGCGLTLLAIASGYPTVVPALIMMGAGMGLLAPSVMARVVGTIAEDKRSQAVGLTQCLLSIAPLLALAVLEPLMPLLGTVGVFLSLGLMSLALGVGFSLVRNKPSLQEGLRGGVQQGA